MTECPFPKKLPDNKLFFLSFVLAQFLGLAEQVSRLFVLLILPIIPESYHQNRAQIFDPPTTLHVCASTRR